MIVDADHVARGVGGYVLHMRPLRSLTACARAMDPRGADALLAAILLVESQLEVLLLRGGWDRAALAALFLAAMAGGLAGRPRAPAAAGIAVPGQAHT